MDSAHLLVVDDDARLRTLLHRFLSEQGFRITTAADAAAARQALSSMSFDLLVLDVMMPGESGLDLTESLRREGHEVPILMLTAAGGPEDRIAGFEHGADDYLAKPFEPRELALRIRTILKRAAPAMPAGLPQAPVQLGPHWFDPERGELRGADGTQRLTGGEAALLSALPRRRGADARGDRRRPGHAGSRRARGGRAGHAPAPQDRARPARAALPADHSPSRLRAAARRLMKRVGRLIRGLLPRGLLGRALLIILLPLLILQGVALQLFYGGHLDVISRRLAGGVAGDVGMVTELLSRFPSEDDRGWIFHEAAWRFDLSLAFEPAASIAGGANRPSWLPILPLEDDLVQALRERMRLPFDTDWQSDPRSVIIRVQMPDGVLHVEAPRKRLFFGTLYLFVIWLVGTSLLLFLVAALFMKNQVRAIRRLASAAESFGIGRQHGPIKPEGAAEVRQAAAAFNQMQGRIRRFINQRTEMLAGISHDLRTPLTRLRLSLAMLPPGAEEDATAMGEDVAEMERLIATYLSFARGEVTEQSQPADLAELVRDLATKARRSGTRLAVEAPDTLVLPLRVDALRRCLGNLLDNARAHAARIVVALREVPLMEAGRAPSRWVEITVDDDGPGIPEASREEAFRPFASFSAGGTGLGLAIARDIARAHGGDVVLEGSPLGGLRARVRLPA